MITIGRMVRHMIREVDIMENIVGSEKEFMEF